MRSPLLRLRATQTINRVEGKSVTVHEATLRSEEAVVIRRPHAHGRGGEHVAVFIGALGMRQCGFDIEHAVLGHIVCGAVFTFDISSAGINDTPWLDQLAGAPLGEPLGGLVTVAGQKEAIWEIAPIRRLDHAYPPYVHASAAAAAAAARVGSREWADTTKEHARYAKQHTAFHEIPLAITAQAKWNNYGEKPFSPLVFSG